MGTPSQEGVEEVWNRNPTMAGAGIGSKPKRISSCMNSVCQNAPGSRLCVSLPNSPDQWCHIGSLKLAQWEYLHLGNRQKLQIRLPPSSHHTSCWTFPSIALMTRFCFADRFSLPLFSSSSELQPHLFFLHFFKNTSVLLSTETLQIVFLQPRTLSRNYYLSEKFFLISHTLAHMTFL